MGKPEPRANSRNKGRFIRRGGTQTVIDRHHRQRRAVHPRPIGGQMQQGHRITTAGYRKPDPAPRKRRKGRANIRIAPGGAGHEQPIDTRAALASAAAGAPG